MDAEYEGTKLFVRSLSEDEIIQFIIDQGKSIKGLMGNNDSFRKAYHDKAETNNTEGD